MLKERDVSFFFVIDPPALLLDSVILTCTLRVHFPDAQVIAYCPENKRNLIPEYLPEFFRHMKVNLRFMPEGKFEPHYKQGNKLVAACQPRTKKHSIFLDTDIAIAKAFDVNLIAKTGQVSVVPEGKFTWGKDQTWWDIVYSKFDMPVPEERVRLARVPKMTIPYFNAGMVSFPTKSKFADQWISIAKAIDADDNVPTRRPWLDQIALPVAITRSGLKADVLEPIFNLTLTRNLEKPVEVAQEIEKVNSADGHILHYHQPMYLTGTRYAEDVDAAMRQFTSWESVDAMMAKPREREAWAAHVWTQLKTLKDKQRTPEEDRQLQEYRIKRDAIKAQRADPKTSLIDQPKSILRAHP